jgi:hypothetical protein
MIDFELRLAGKVFVAGCTFCPLSSTGACAAGVSREDIAILAADVGVLLLEGGRQGLLFYPIFSSPYRNIADNNFFGSTQVYFFRLRFPACIELLSALFDSLAFFLEMCVNLVVVALSDDFDHLYASNRTDCFMRSFMWFCLVYCFQ